jgi:hypothetical protein
MPHVEWLEGPAWLAAIAFLVWAVVRSVAWALQIRSAMDADRHPHQPTNGSSAEWRGETRQVLKHLRSALADSTSLDREMLNVLRDVRDELRDHNAGAHRRHELVEQIHQAVTRRK